MAKRSGKGASAALLFIDSGKKRHPNLFLPKLLQEESQKAILSGTSFDNAKQVLLN